MSKMGFDIPHYIHHAHPHCRDGVLGIAIATIGLALPAMAAQPTVGGYPLIRLVVPFAAGGPVELIARAITPRMSEIFRQQLVVDNRGGAGSTLGT